MHPGMELDDNKRGPTRGFWPDIRGVKLIVDDSAAHSLYPGPTVAASAGNDLFFM